MKFLNRLKSSMAVNIIGAIIFLLVILSVIVSVLGFMSFTDAFKKEYSTTTWHIADTATTLINGDHLDAYLAGKEQEEYQLSKGYLEGYCKRIHVSLVYVIQVDRSDYGRFVSIFNLVNNAVDNTSYREWEIGHWRDTTNDEYRQKYEMLYEKEVPYATVYRTNPGDAIHPHITHAQSRYQCLLRHVITDGTVT